MAIKLTAWAVRSFGRRTMTPLLYAIVFYFFATGRTARRHIRLYQKHLADWSGRPGLAPRTGSVFAQFMRFGECLLDRLDAWRGKLGPADVDMHDPSGVRDALRASGNGVRGQILVCTHLGNLDVCRAMAEAGERVPLNVLVHTRNAVHFNRVMNEAGDHGMRLIQVSDLDTAVMMDLSQRLARGEWIAIAGDRIPLHGGRSVTVDFLGRPAAFPQGPWLVASLLRCQTNLICCLKIKGRYRIHLERGPDASAWDRRERDARISESVRGYAHWLGQRCLDAPHQWFNFHHYWNDKD
nr:glycosyl transferase [Luteibacter sp. Sphag1AF]